MRKLILFLLALTLSASVSGQSCCDAKGPKVIAGQACFSYPNFGSFPGGSNPSATANSTTLNTTGYKFAIMGYIRTSDRKSHLCTAAGGCSIGWRPGAITWANVATTFDVGLQGVSTAAGPPAQPDGTYVVKNTLVPGTDSLTSNTWTNTDIDTETGTLTVADGDLKSIVWDLTNRAGADSLIVLNTNTAITSHYPVSSNYTGSWAAATVVGNAIITFDDGAYGWIDGTYGLSNASAITAYNSGSATDEQGLVFTAPLDMRADGIWLNWFPAASGDADLVLYSSPTSTSPVALATISTDANASGSNSAARTGKYRFATPVYLKRGAQYGVMLKPTSANNVTLQSFTVSTAGFLASYAGTNAVLGGRADGAGAFSLTSTIAPLIGIEACAISQGP